ncbi:MAG: ferritin family protein [Candidatus Marinimicrobia bacterium]|nr:ferritin family protein [Candidatus Neomarinimicrobiota bacterium]
MFKPSEVYQFAVKIEENGEHFYRKIVEKMEDEEVKELFQFLADEEVKHQEIFEKMLEKIEDYNPPESYPGEYFNYLRSYAENLIFSIETLEQELADIDSSLSAINYGIKKELNTISYYNEIKNMVPDSEVNKIESIIAEERKHVVKLSEIKESLNK